MYESDGEHDESLGIRQFGLSASVKATIAEVKGTGHLTPKLLTNALQLKLKDLPPPQQLKNHLQYQNKVKSTPIVHLRDLKRWCQSRTDPQDDDEVFVIAQEYHYEREDLSLELESDEEEVAEEKHNRFTIICSTKRLLTFASYSQALHADGTYKLNFAGFPAIVLGVSDKDRTFHPVGMAVTASESNMDYAYIFNSLKKAVQLISPSYSPTILIADSAVAITNGFTDAFGEPEKRINCWAHVDAKCRLRLGGTDKETRDSIMHDINLLQRSPCSDVFELASTLFIKKWKSSSRPNVQSFVDYFSKQWIEENDGWYEGKAVFFPSTNNGLEATNRWIKAHETFRNKLSLGKSAFALYLN